MFTINGKDDKRRLIDKHILSFSAKQFLYLSKLDPDFLTSGL